MFAVQDIVFQMNRLLSALSQYNEHCYKLMSDTNVFPIELDLPQTTFQYADTPLTTPDYHDDDEDDEDDEPLVIAEEALPDSKPDDDPLKNFLEDEQLPNQLVNLNLLGD